MKPHIRGLVRLFHECEHPEIVSIEAVGCWVLVLSEQEGFFVDEENVLELKDAYATLSVC